MIMISAKWFLYSKQIHRICMFITILLGVIIMPTGILLNYSFLYSYFSFINPGNVRQIHAFVSPYFSISILIMMITGVIMYIFPLFKKK